MKTRKILIASVLAVALLGCGKQQPRHIVILPDVSGSIDRQSLEQTFKAIDELASHLRRGDRLAIIPILSDAQAQAPGHILRSEASMSRQAYDADLREFRLRMRDSLNQLSSSAIAHPGSKTDILGSLALAEQEFQPPDTSERLLFVLTDFVEDDGERWIFVKMSI